MAVHTEPYDGPIVTLAEARAAGLPLYFPGPCRAGHSFQRKVHDRGCPGCSIQRAREWKERNAERVGAKRNTPEVRAYHAAYAAENREKMRGIARRWRERNPELSNAKAKVWRESNPEKQRAAEIAYRANNPEKRKASVAAHRAKPGVAEREKATRQAWAAQNLDKLAAKAAARRALKMQATPRWADGAAIAQIYRDAQRITGETGIEHHVDHIVPLKSKWVCGLHCEANMRIIPGSENQSKMNRWWPDMWDL